MFLPSYVSFPSWVFLPFFLSETRVSAYTAFFGHFCLMVILIVSGLCMCSLLCCVSRYVLDLRSVIVPSAVSACEKQSSPLKLCLEIIGRYSCMSVVEV